MSSLIRLCLFASFALPLTCAQDLGVPGEDDTGLNHNQRVAKAQAAVAQVLPQLNASSGLFNGIGYWQSANVWSAISNLDHISGETKYQSAVTSGLGAVSKSHSAFYETKWWGTAAYYAYRAYGNTAFLNDAVNVWNTVSQYVISQADASSGVHPKKSFPIAGTCGSATMAGGVFWQNTESDPDVNAITTGLYVTLSAFLAEATGDSKYTNAAILSAEWVQNQDYDSSDHLVLDTVNGQSCDRSPATELFTYNSGKFIEGLSVLGTVTGNSEWENLMVNTLAAAVKSSAWQGANGVITEASGGAGSNSDVVGFKAIFIRGLYEAFSRSPSESGLQILVHSYIDVQYNALLELASTGDTYSGSWVGPPRPFTTWGQMTALDVLASAVGANAN